MKVPTVAASVTAQSITPVNLSKKAFKKRKKRGSPSSSIIPAKPSNSCSASDNSSIIYVRAKKKKTRTNKNKNNLTTGGMTKDGLLVDEPLLASSECRERFGESLQVRRWEANGFLGFPG
jgi:hypothetical protein